MNSKRSAQIYELTTTLFRPIGQVVKKWQHVSKIQDGSGAILNCGYLAFRRHRWILNQSRPSNIPTNFGDDSSNNKEMATQMDYWGSMHKLA